MVKRGAFSCCVTEADAPQTSGPFFVEFLCGPLVYAHTDLLTYIRPVARNNFRRPGVRRGFRLIIYIIACMSNWKQTYLERGGTRLKLFYLTTCLAYNYTTSMHLGILVQF